MASTEVEYQSNTEDTLTEYNVTEAGSDLEWSGDEYNDESEIASMIDWMNSVVQTDVQKLQQLNPVDRVNLIPSLRQKIKWLRINDERYKVIGDEIIVRLDHLKNLSILLIEG